jgi:CubicO group peptidase (beta-lactamase class C family)
LVGLRLDQRLRKTNHGLAGLLVREVTGRPIGKKITTRVIEPLDLEGTWTAGGDILGCAVAQSGPAQRSGTRPDS